MTRLHKDFVKGTLSIALSPTDTTMVSAALTAVGPVADPDVLAITLDPESDNPEIVHITDLAEGVATATIVRGQEADSGGGAARSHASGTKWVHAVTSVDLVPAGARLDFAPDPSPVVTTSGDVTTHDSWYGDAAVRYMTWTPTASGTIDLQAPAADVDNMERDYVVFSGTTVDVDYPGRSTPSQGYSTYKADSYVYSGGASPDQFDCVAGTTYTIGIVYWGSGSVEGRSISLVELFHSLQPFGGIDPPIAPSAPSAVLVNPDGTLGLAPPPVDLSGNNDVLDPPGSVAFGFGNQVDHTSISAGAGNIATGQRSAAFGQTAHATGDYSVATNFLSTASGMASSAGGETSTASGEAAFAFGLGNTASGVGAQAFGWGAVADRPGEQALGGGTVNFTKTAQASRLLANAHTSDASPTDMMFPQNLNTTFRAFSANTFRGMVVAYCDHGSVNATDYDAAAWTFDGLVVSGGGSGSVMMVNHSVTQIAATSAASAWTFTVDVFSVSGFSRYSFRCTGAASTSIYWTAYIDEVRVS